MREGHEPQKMTLVQISEGLASPFLPWSAHIEPLAELMCPFLIGRGGPWIDTCSKGRDCWVFGVTVGIRNVKRRFDAYIRGSWRRPPYPNARAVAFTSLASLSPAALLLRCLRFECLGLSIFPCSSHCFLAVALPSVVASPFSFNLHWPSFSGP